MVYTVVVSMLLLWYCCDKYFSSVSCPLVLSHSPAPLFSCPLSPCFPSLYPLFAIPYPLVCFRLFSLCFSTPARSLPVPCPLVFPFVYHIVFGCRPPSTYFPSPFPLFSFPCPLDPHPLSPPVSARHNYLILLCAYFL